MPSEPMVIIASSEFTLKSAPVRRTLEQRLLDDVRTALTRAGVHDVRPEKHAGRIVIAGVKDAAAIAEACSRIFGVAYAANGLLASASMDEVLKAIVDTASAHLEDGQSFAVRAHRSGPTKISRREIEVKGGSEILSQLGERHVTVDLTHPDVTVYVDLADDRAYVYATKLPGPGGLPLSSQWKMLAVLDSGALSILAAYAMMRRGCMVELFIPISRQVGAFERESQLKLAHGLSALVTRPNYKAHLFEVDEANGPVIPHSPNPGNLRAIALAFARKKRFKGVIFADVGGQLDTIRRDVEGEPVPPVPFYPLIGFDNEDLVQLSIEVGIPLGEVNFARSIEQTSLRLAPGSDPAEHVETILL